MPSFDVVSKINMQEMDNAINITAREITTRYDLKDQKCNINFNKNDKQIIAEAANEMALKAMSDILQNRSINRGISIKVFDFGKVVFISSCCIIDTAILVNIDFLYLEYFPKYILLFLCLIFKSYFILFFYMFWRPVFKFCSKE